MVSLLLERGGNVNCKAKVSGDTIKYCQFIKLFLSSVCLPTVWS